MFSSEQTGIILLEQQSFKIFTQGTHGSYKSSAQEIKLSGQTGCVCLLLLSVVYAIIMIKSPSKEQLLSRARSRSHSHSVENKKPASFWFEKNSCYVILNYAMIYFFTL